MYKIFPIFIFLIYFLNPLVAKEPFMAILQHTYSNDTQIFKHANTKFICKAYGIISIDDIYVKADKESQCKKSIELFYKKRRYLSNYAKIKLKIYQSYSLILKENNRCLVNIAGEKSLSEFLIEKGWALLEKDFQDKEYRHYFHLYEKKAKLELQGIWNSDIIENCYSFINTPDKTE